LTPLFSDMPHNVSLIALIAAGFGLAMILGLIASRLRMFHRWWAICWPGWPSARGRRASSAILPWPGQLAEIGVMLLMFGVGLHFSLGDLLAVRKIAVPGAIVQIAVATVLGRCHGPVVGLAHGRRGGGVRPGPVGGQYGGAAAGTGSQGLCWTPPTGALPSGWLVVEDLAMVMVLVLLPALAPLLGGGEATPSGARLTRRWL
jgi:CPA2 family monovalent cation:H+ antiporter-2